MNRKTRLLLLPSSQSGAAAIELAFILPLLLLILGGMVEFGRAMWHYDALAKGARDAARYLSTVHTADLKNSASTSKALVDKCTTDMPTPVPAYCFVANAATKAGVADLSPDNATITCAPTSCSGAVLSADVTTVTVAIDYPFKVGGWIPVFGLGDGASPIDVVLSPHVTMPYMR